MTDLLTFTTFNPLVGQKFRVSSGNHDEEKLELIEVNALPVQDNAPRQEPFSLVFRGDKACGLWQGSVQLEHASIGSTDFFLVPIGEDDKGMYFQALFN